MPKRLSPAYLERMRERYKNALRKEKTRILSDFQSDARYRSRKHANRVLLGHIEPRTNKPGPAPKYGEGVIYHLKVLWEEMGRICSKKMKGALPLWLPFYKVHRHSATHFQHEILRINCIHNTWR